MTDIDNLFIRRPRAIRITPFTPKLADIVAGNEQQPIYYIKTREGKRHITAGMLIAEKSETYRHPMDPDVFAREYINLLGYESAFAAELKDQIAQQLRRALDSDDLHAEIDRIAGFLSSNATQASLHQEHEEA